MAWDGLGSIFKQKDKQGSNEARDTVAPQAAAGGYGGGNSAPVTQPYAGFGGNAGSAAGPVSAKFVNFGTLYGLNEDKAKGMAKGVYDSAAAAADKAKGQLQGARETFNQNLQQGTAKGVVSGPHGTRIDNYNPTAPATAKPFTQARKGEAVATSGAGPGSFLRGAQYDANGNAIDETQPTTGSLTQTLEGTGTRGLSPTENYSGAGGTLTGGASRYSNIYGPVSSMGSIAGAAAETPDKEALKDYHASVDLLGAKSGAGQGYTGPGSLKESMGEQAYADLQKALGNAETGAQNLTTEGGVQNALGYEPGVSTGNSAMDTGLTETAGREQFKRLADQTKGLGTLLPQAQADSERAAAGAGIQSADAAKQWQDLLDEYEAQQTAENAPKPGEPGGPPKKSSGSHIHGLYTNDTNAAALTQESGFTASEVEDAWGDFTQEEREYLARGHNVFENLTGYGFSGDEATLKASILMKLANRRAGKA